MKYLHIQPKLLATNCRKWKETDNYNKRSEFMSWQNVSSEDDREGKITRVIAKDKLLTD